MLCYQLLRYQWYYQLMAETLQNVRGSQQGHQSGILNQTIFYHELANMKAMKMAVLIRFAQLPYLLEENKEEESHPHILRTPQGELTTEYQIITYIINDSREQQRREIRSSKDKHSLSHDSQPQEPQKEEREGVNLCGEDLFISAKMHEELYYLRINLFPLLEEFYKYLLGHQKIKKLKYDSLINKIKKEIGILDSKMNEHSEIFAYQQSFLNVIIVCELFMACKFVFQQKFRKSKYYLFNKYEKISTRPQFQEIYGKTTLCLKQYVPPQFEEEVELEVRKAEEVLPVEITKLSETVMNAPQQPQNNRNQLLYNYFKSIFPQHESKVNYFPYFWMMFDHLSCTLVEFQYNGEDQGCPAMSKKIKMLQFELQKYLHTSIDYGIMGIYQKSDKYFMRGVLCLGSKTLEDIQYDLQNSIELKQYSTRKIDVTSPQERKEFENIWENNSEHSTYEDVTLCMLAYI